MRKTDAVRVQFCFSVKLWLCARCEYIKQRRTIFVIDFGLIYSDFEASAGVSEVLFTTLEGGTLLSPDLAYLILLLLLKFTKSVECGHALSDVFCREVLYK